MKKNFKTMMSAMLAIGLLAAGCVKEGGVPDGTEQKEGEVSKMVLTVSTVASKGAATRAASETEDPTASELTVNTADGLKVAIFNTSGVFEKWYDFETLTQTGDSGTEAARYTTPVGTPIQLTGGQSYYFFVFANDGEDKITPATASLSMDAWMKEAVAVDYNASTGASDAIAKADDFLIGTLWKATVAVPAQTTAEPAVLEIPTALGRLSAKIWVSHLASTALQPQNTELKGAFTAASYTIGSAAKAMNTVGVVEGADNPFATGRLVKSYLHEGASASDYNSDSYTSYFTTFKPVALDAGDAAANSAQVFYAAENTTAKSSITSGPQNAQFYGNTTYIALQLKYTPLNSEVYTVDGEEVGAVVVGGDTPYTGGTFYTAIVNGQRLLFNASPDGIDTDPSTAGIQSPGDRKEYTNGIGYYAFPVQDVGETDPVIRNRVLRNHYYEYIVTKITDLGAATLEEIIDDDEPIAETSDIVLTVKVGKWDKVTTGEIEL